MDETVLIDREEECRQLLRLLNEGRPRLALLSGRRRVGKTFLLNHAWGDRPYFLFTAARTTPELNRRQLIEDLARWSGQDLRPEDYPTWRSVFSLLLGLQAADPMIVVLDEFQYLSTDASGLAAVASELNAVWEGPRAQRPFLLVLAGSAVATMEALSQGGGPLYGRFNWQHRLQPFDYWDAGTMVPYADPRDRALTYGLFGGTPRYLAALNPEAPLAANAQRLLLARSGEVRLLIETALDQEEGLRDVQTYNALLRAVASGCTERNDIAQRVGVSNDQGLRDKLGRLVRLGYLEARTNIDARRNAPVRYAMADAAFRFHQRFVEPATSMLERYAPARVWDERVAPHLDVYMGLEFECIAREGYDRHADQHGLPLVDTWGRWEGVDRAQASIEIDLVAHLSGGRVLTGAVKWNRTPIGAEVHYRHLDMLRRAADAGQRWAHQALEPNAPLYYAAAGGFAPDFERIAASSGHPVLCWSLADLYAS
ncbi:MAG: ATP-binding protein [Bacteroidota bacterium]